jgi:hypothetical protein
MMRTMIGVAAGAILAGVLFFARCPQAQEPARPGETPVSESEVQTYIDVYGAMQADHDLDIHDVVTQHHLTLEEFRDIERRIQRQPALVDRVRQALLEKAKARASSITPPTRGVEQPEAE